MSSIPPSSSAATTARVWPPLYSPGLLLLLSVACGVVFSISTPVLLFQQGLTPSAPGLLLPLLLGTQLFTTGLAIWGCRRWWLAERRGEDLQTAGQQALQHSEERLRSIISSTPIGICITNEAGLFEFVNPAYEAIYGYSREELLGQSFTLVVPPDFRAQMQQLHRDFLDGGHEPRGQWKVLARGGRELTILADAARITGRDGQRRKVTFVMDITDKQAAEEALQEAKQEADRANRAKSAFLANMSHELRTPLNGILGYAQILQRDATLGPQQQQGVNIIHRSGHYLLTLINDVLDLAKIESERFELHPAPMDLQPFLQGVVELFQMRAEQNGISFYHSAQEPLPVALKADEKRLRQILINLLGNAVKFTETGSVTLHVAYANGDLLLRVKDTGMGMRPEEMNTIFEAFGQAGSQDYQNQGTGLGLFITQQLVQMMNGDLTVASTPGQGSEFQVRVALPETQESHTSRGSSPEIIGFQGPVQRLLIIDDRVENRDMLGRLLQPLGFEIDQAQDGQAGLRKLDSFMPHLVITDLVMPRVDGFEFTRRLRQHQEYYQTPVIAVSASVFADDRRKSHAAGCDLFIPKPIRAQALFEGLQNLLDLEWCYADGADAPTVSPTRSVTKNPNGVQGLAPQQAACLHELAMLGDVAGLEQQLDSWQQDGQHPALDEIRQLTQAFQLDEICDLVSPHLDLAGH